MIKYNPEKIEKKWQKKWEESEIFKIDKEDCSKKKFYVLDMFPYPSGEGLHMGHTESYTASDIFYRYKKMRGYNVLHPQGFDSFGLPAENYAIKTGIKPEITTKKNIETYVKQMKSLGLAYNFDEKIITSDPSYYKWTQWIFGKFFENDLVYKKTQKTNWCPSCQTVIANEQVVNGECERCGTIIEQKEIPGWFFKITDFAEDLIEDLNDVDWPEHTKKNQINWIGKSEGARINFPIKDSEMKIDVFTTRPDTIFGATYVVLAPEHQLISEIKEKIINWNEVEKYILESKNKTELDRLESKDKTGKMLEGVFAINPANKKEIPIFIADYVLASYGTGAIMAVPAHDERDWEFANKYNIPLIEVISGGDIKKAAYIGDGKLINSDKFNGMYSIEAKQEIAEAVSGEMTVNYRLRDWSISRQRYWGCPIPIVYSPEGEAKLIPEKYLPWTLPTDVDFVPTGVAPLEKSKELKERVEKIFGKGWTAEYDTMDTFVDSSWYFLRYPDPKNENELCSEKRKNYWLPVDLYIGGAEHTYMHLLFARFFVKAMNKVGLIGFNEPFFKLRHQGMVLDKNGKKMSKSKGNVINPDDMINKFGADSVRMYMMFASPLEDEVVWNEENIVGVYRFLEKVWDESRKILKNKDAKTSSELLGVLHSTIKKVEEDVEELKYNTAISEMMKFVNIVKKSSISKSDFEDFIKILAPFAPHVTEEIWEMLGNKESVSLSLWPIIKKEYLIKKEVELAVQVNGKVRDRISVSVNANEKEVMRKILESERVRSYIEGKEIKKTILVPGKLISIVVG